MIKRSAVLLGLLTAFAVPVLAQDSAPDEKTEFEKDRAQFSDFDKTIKEWKATEGFFRLYRKEKEERLLAAIPKDLLDQPFFLATSVAGGSDYAGWQWQDKLVRFERFNKKLLLVELNTRQRAAKDKPVASVVRRTFADRHLAALDIKAIGPKGEVLIDLGYLLTRQSGIFFGGLFSVNTSLARFAKTTKAFRNNIEVSAQFPLYGDGTFVTLHYSISRLPKLDSYTPRVADDRLGYFLTAIRDYTSGDPREGRMVRYVNRWQLEKADPDLALSPPKEPIVFYVEKTVPIAYRHAVHQGILEWNAAFEKIGIVGAIEVRQQSETQFADYDPEDVNYNFFRWITSESAFAMGPSRVDPRSGRILDADIIFDDSMLRGYMRDYDTLIRENAEKLLTSQMKNLLERNPSRHPMARFRAAAGTDSRKARMRELLGELSGAPQLSGTPLKSLGEAGPIKTRAEFERLPERVRNAETCSLGEFLPHKVGLARLALGALKEGSGAIPDAVYTEYLAEIVKETVMHEVGHTLGLRHNFKASSRFDLDALNSKERPTVLSASVMDYHPINLIVGSDARPQGHFLTQTVGPYDMLAIEYGYKLCDEDDKELKAVARRVAEQGLPYATDEDTRSPDPLIATWDLGDDPVKFATYRTALVKKLWTQLEKRTVADNESYSRLRRALDITLFEIGGSANFVARQVGGLEFARDHRGDPNARPPIQVTDAARQRESLAWVCKNVFASDAFDVPKGIQDKLAAGRWVHWGSGDGNSSLEYSLLDRILRIQTWALFFLTSDDVLARVWENEQRPQKGTPLTLPELFDTLETAIFSELGVAKTPTASNPAVSSRRQNLQDAYVRQLISISLAKDIAPPVARKLAWSRLKALEERFGNVLATAELDPYSRAHLEVLAAQSTAARTARYVHVASGVSGCSLAPATTPRPWPLGVLLASLMTLGLLRRRSA
jgi:hypothetical protein